MDNFRLIFNGNFYDDLSNFLIRWDNYNDYVVFKYPAYDFGGNFENFCFGYSFTEESFAIEKIKSVFCIPSLPFLHCIFYGIHYILYPFEPNYDYFTSLTEIKKKDLNYELRLIGIFHWIIGYKSKIINRKLDYGYFLSAGPYKFLGDRENFSMTKIDCERFFPELNSRDEFSRIFNDPKLRENLSLILQENLTKHYVVIIARINKIF